MLWVEINNFTPLQGLAGGALLGLGAAGLMLFNGRVAGFSGVINQAMTGKASWAIAFLVGVAASATLVHKVLGLEAPDLPVSPALIIAGLLVGFGSRLGNGCTSGHGVCGLSRFSVRSLVAVITFMATAMITVFLMATFITNQV